MSGRMADERSSLTLFEQFKECLGFRWSGQDGSIPCCALPNTCYSVSRRDRDSKEVGTYRLILPPCLRVSPEIWKWISWATLGGGGTEAAVVGLLTIPCLLTSREVGYGVRGIM
jgi:hypothetical protein